MNVQQRGITVGTRGYVTLFLRVALAAAFLTSVTDRLGIWGPHGMMNVA